MTSRDISVPSEARLAYNIVGSCLESSLFVVRKVEYGLDASRLRARE